MKNIAPFVFLLIWTSLLFAQGSDCGDARILKLSREQSLFVIDSVAQGPGEVNEISAERGDKYFFRKEHFTHWYKFRVPFTGVLAMEIRPFVKSDDYDFLLFSDSTGGGCDQVLSRESKPSRSVISRNDPSIQSQTGLDAYSKITHRQEGIGPSFGQAIEVKRGEIYYLLIDNVYGGGEGYELEFFYYYQLGLRGKVVDSETLEPLEADIFIRLDSTEVTVDSLKSDKLTGEFQGDIPLLFENDYKISIQKNGYFPENIFMNYEKYKKLRNKPLEVKLTPMRTGVSLTLREINFYGSQARFLPSARRPLGELLQMMQDYPGLKVRIDGHVNGVGTPDCEHDAFNNSLSWDRAKAVQKYLLDNGIAAERMEIKGFGCTQMIYPEARNEAEMAVNRRVELKILELE